MFETNPNLQQFTIGIVYCFIAFLAFPVYIQIIHTIYFTKELNDNVSYKLINTMNIGDLVQSFLHVLTGLFIIFPTFTQKVLTFVKIVGYTNNCLFNSSFVIIAVLALIRLGVSFFHLNTNKWKFWMKKKRQTQSYSSHRAEIAILIQASVLTTYMGLLMALWHNAELWFEMTDITFACLNGSWIVFPHLNSFLLIVTNRSIRMQFLTLRSTKPNFNVAASSTTGVKILFTRSSATVTMK
ncbi:hypothetical protein GCK72_018501 [Caenorhabditis remanei]|uniref:7TM GPCR serpentine receptor class x (Srx) domain-containing protein n=1 Tax=Caenorhabditis remanei TaxID=31234 RepID=A0A6A5G9X8_CAERE|nr:hypothetical protein GCK72_018501 [Caenorhabditis remanei]KAF1751947.1 hypothetical protein GCK72_018501 [Caenorhabditis remanei]